MRQDLGCALILSLVASACAADKPATFEDVAPIFARSCTHCHTAHGIAPFSLETYGNALEYAHQIESEVESGRMPPWDAVRDDDCRPPRPFMNDETLSAHDRDVILSWTRNGALEGTPGATAIATQPPTLETWDVNAAMEAPYTPPVGVDDYHCFVVDPGFSTDRYVTAMDFIPGNPAVVHHASLLADVTRSLAAKIGPAGFDCSTEITSGGLRELDPWTP